MDGISLGPILLRWNGLLIMVGVTFAALLAVHESKRRAYDPEIILDLVAPMMIWGTLCARIWHVLTPPLSSIQLGLTTRHYLTHPLDFLAIWVGGLGFPGALIGGVIALLIFCRIYEFKFWELADILAPAIALGQAIGRLGNYFNQELYGFPTMMSWKIFISPEHRLMGYETVEYYHPLFAYESLLSLLNLAFLLWISHRFVNKPGSGDLFLMYLFNAAIIRFLLEFLRLDVALVNGININQIFMGILIVFSAACFYMRNHAVQKL